MTFVLPGNTRSLRFTGEARALGPHAEDAGGPRVTALGTARATKAATAFDVPKPPVATGPGPKPTLGKPRERKPTPPRRIITPVPASASPAGTAITTPSAAPAVRRTTTPPISYHDDRPHLLSVPYVEPSRGALLRGHFDDNSLSDRPTMALEREDVLPGAIRAQKPVAAPNAPAIPHFRTQAITDAPPPVVSPAVTEEKRGLPYAVWLVASLLMGIMSYHAVPGFIGGVAAAPAPAAQSVDP